MKLSFRSLALGVLMTWTGPTLAEKDPPFLVHQLAEGETLAELASQHLGSAEAIDELVRFNQLANPTAIKPGDLVAVPVGLRQEAVAALQQADQAVKEAAKAMAETYASEEFAETKRTWTAARNSRGQASYDRAVAMANLCVAYAAAARRLADARAPIQQEAQIAALHGAADISADDGATWAAAKAGDKLPVKAVLRTGADARAELALADGTTIQVMENSQFRIYDFIYDRRDGQRHSILDILLGEIMGKVKPKEVPASEFRLRSGDAAISIRGTQLRVGASADETMRMSVLEGQTVVSAQGRDADIPENFGTFARKGAPPAPPVELLAPPAVRFPADTTHETALQRVPFLWEPVEDDRLDRYVLEIARDPAFNTVVQKAEGDLAEWTSATLGEGDYLWRMYSVDRHGLAGKFSETRTLKIRLHLDIQLAPALDPYQKGDRLIVGPANRYVAQPARADTSVAGLEYSVNGQPFAAYAEPFALTEAGPNRIVARGVSAEGKTGGEQALDVVLDNQPPRVSAMLGAPEPHPDLGKAVTIKLEAKDDTALDRIEYRLDQGDYTAYTEPIVLSVYTAYDLSYRAADVVGNVSPPRTVSLQAEVATRR